MQFDEARDTISRLIREAIPGGAPANPAPAPLSAALGGINFFGGANVVQIHMSASPATAAQELLDPVQIDHPAVLARRKQVLLARLKTRSASLGKPDLYQRFLRSVYGTARVEDLGTTALERALAWLETES